MTANLAQGTLMRSISVAVAVVLALSLAGLPTGAASQGTDRAGGRLDPLMAPISRLQNTRLSTGDSVGDLLSHPAFAGFARQVLPWDDRLYDSRMGLREVGALLPYHSQVDPEVVVSALNRMIDDFNQQRTVFYDFYGEREKQQDPSKANTGLFFFRGEPGAPFALIAPGGGFAYVGSLHEGFPYAEAINRHGYNAFVVRYRAGQGGRVATEDMAAAVSFIVSNAAALRVAAAGYSLWGSSAGARMAAAIGSHGVAAFGGDDIPGPSAVIMAYTAHLDVSDREPPTFAVVGEDDRIAPPATMERRVALLRKAGTRVEYHRYPSLGHGFGAGIGTPAEGWIAEATRFWSQAIAELKN